MPGWLYSTVRPVPLSQVPRTPWGHRSRRSSIRRRGWGWQTADRPTRSTASGREICSARAQVPRVPKMALMTVAIAAASMVNQDVWPDACGAGCDPGERIPSRSSTIIVRAPQAGEKRAAHTPPLRTVTAIPSGLKMRIQRSYLLPPYLFDTFDNLRPHPCAPKSLLLTDSHPPRSAMVNRRAG